MLLTVMLGFLLLLPLVCSLEFLSAVVPSKGVIKITPSGAVIGTDKIRQNGNVYTLAEDIMGDVATGSVFINIERDDIVFDGAGKTIRGTDSGIAIGVYGKNNVTIKNIRIIDFGTGIEMSFVTLTDSDNEMFFVDSSNSAIIDSYFETRWGSIELRGVKHFVSGNTFIARNGLGAVFRSKETIFGNNKFIDCTLSYWEFDSSNIISDNTVNGKPLVILEGQSNKIIDGAGMVILINCTDMIIKNVDASRLNNTSGFNYPIALFGINNSLITNCKGAITISAHNSLIIDNEFSRVGGTWQAAAMMLSGSNNTVTQNSIVGVNCCGLIVSGSHNYIEKNNIVASSNSGLDNIAGITLSGSRNYVYENVISSEEIGLNLSGEYNIFCQNNVTLKHGRWNIYLNSAISNDILGNNIQGSSEYAISLVSSDFNNFVWNNFRDNTKVNEVHETYWMTFTNSSYYAEYNKWDNGKEGNHWSDYNGQDTNGNGIGKTPYRVYGNFTDNYPLTQPYDISKIQVTFEKWDGSSIDLQVHTDPQLHADEVNVSKDFLIIAIAAVISVAIIAVVCVVFLWRFKNGSKTKVV
ncbi:MAG: right-handed parallel beta-helix repeat-containing protein [Candidatus Bathyarchaeota archaeon]|nr:right-handed parallel beta-helix repeat-containing protein [Candidatus Termiticorpusculum sp.]